MFALDLFNNDYERRLAEGAVDQLEQRRIDDLAMKMDDLVARAKQVKDPEHKAALVKEFQKVKAERDSYFKIKDESMGYGSLGEENINEGAMKEWLWKEAERLDLDAFVANAGEYGMSPEEAVEWWNSINGDLDEAKWDPFTGGDFSDTHDMNHLPNDDAEEPDSKEQAKLFKSMLQYYGNNILVTRALWDLNRLTHGENMSGENMDLKVEATIERNGKTEVRYFRSKQDAYNKAQATGARVISIKPIESDLPKDLITLPVIFGLGDHKKKWMLQFPDERKAQQWEFTHKNVAQIQWPAGHGLAEAGDVKAKTDDALLAYWEKVKREKQAGTTTSVPTEKIPGKADLLKGKGRTYYEGQKKSSEQVDEEKASWDYDLRNNPWHVTDVDFVTETDFEVALQGPDNQQLNFIIRPIDFIEQQTQRFQIDSMDVRDLQSGKTMHWNSGSNIGHWILIFDAIDEYFWQSKPLQQQLRNIIDHYLEGGEQGKSPDLMPGLADRPSNGTSIPADRFIKAHDDMKKVTGQDLDEKKLGQLRPTLGSARDMGKSVKKFRAQRGLDESQQLHRGDPVVVTAPNKFEGATGEIYDFAPSGKFVIVNLYNHGKHSMHLSDVEYNQYADDQAEEDDWYDDQEDTLEEANVNPQFIVAQVTKLLATEARRITNAPMAQLLAPVMKEYNLTLQQIDGMMPGGLKRAAGEYGIMMKEGWSNKMVARRTGQAPTPYSIYIQGKEWKSFPDDDHAEAVANKLRAKFKADGRDPGVITIAPTDYDKDIKEMDKSQTPPGRAGDYPLGVKGTTGKPVTAKKVIKDLTKDLEKAFSKEKKVKEAGSPAQQAAIAIAKKKEQGVEEAISKNDLLAKLEKDLNSDEFKNTPVDPNKSFTRGDHWQGAGPDDYGYTGYQGHGMPKDKPKKKTKEAYTPSPAKPFRNPRGFNKQGTGVGDRLAQLNRAELANIKPSTGTPVPGKEFAQGVLKDLKKVNVKEIKADPTGSWVVYNGSKVKRFKSHGGAKAYAEKNGGKVASSEFYADKIQKQGVAEGQQPMNRNAVIQKLEAIYTKLYKDEDPESYDLPAAVDYWHSLPADQLAMEFEDAIDRLKQSRGSIDEAQTDYQKRRARERDIDAGRPVKPVPRNPQTDYARKRAKDKRDMELGEDDVDDFVKAGGKITYGKPQKGPRRPGLSLASRHIGGGGDKMKSSRTGRAGAAVGGKPVGIKEEDQDNSGVERAILNRIMVAHTDLLKQFGPQKVMQAAEEVAYNVGDVDEIGSSDVSAYVHQVRQILGAQ